MKHQVLFSLKNNEKIQTVMPTPRICTETNKSPLTFGGGGGGERGMKYSQLSSAAVVIGALRVNFEFC